MPDSREWARGLSQDDFAREFQRRNPFGDVIPAVGEWVDGHEPVYNGIPDIPPESYVEDGPAEVLPKAPESKAEEPFVRKTPIKKKYYCRGCNQDFDYAIARSGHERHCKASIITKEAAHAGA